MCLVNNPETSDLRNYYIGKGSYHVSFSTVWNLVFKCFGKEIFQCFKNLLISLSYLGLGICASALNIFSFIQIGIRFLFL